MKNTLKKSRSVEKYIMKKLKNKPLHFSLIDPDPSKTKIEYVIDAVSKLEDAGTDAIMVGGSSGVKNSFLDKVIISIKESCSLPIILFPGNPETGVSKHAHAVFFLCLMNSKDMRFATGYQSIGARLIKIYGIEPIPVGYIIIEPGMTVGKNAELIKRDEIDKAIGYALAAQYMGMRLVYLEAGSGAYEPVPLEMIKAVKHEIDIPLIVGGGIKTEEQAKNAIIAGADIIVTGTIIEKDIKKSIEIVKAIKSLKRRKLKNKR
ncbi:MAG: geranylgeranylglyceryl/heptaprenylglyceryl phosphate synthase [Candidatus Aenigmatarchaeota archaeon]|nr:geranylgeranylglyceryl/heptaprenylglyceryl phosphate synthase [Candidatus Aenigmarchaeota archaeon]